MISTVKEGAFIRAAWGAQDYTAVANAINKASGGAGLTVGIDQRGGIKIELGDNEFQFRNITIAEHSTMEDGSDAILFRRVKVLCTAPSDPFMVVPVSGTGTAADTDCCRAVMTDNRLSQIIFGKASAFAAYDADNDDTGLTFIEVVQHLTGGEAT